MIKNYLTVAFRNLWRNKFYSGLNILGLSMGIACTIVILSYVKNEFEYDKFHRKFDRIIRITEKIKDDAGKHIHSATTPSPVAKSISENINGIDQVGRLFPYEVFVSHNQLSRYLEKNFVFADSSITSIFTFQVVDGELHDFNKPFSLIITESTAIKYFGETSVVGKTLKYEDEFSKYDFNIIAVIKDLPEVSHFDFNFIASFVSLETIMPWYESWHWPPMYTYALVTPDTHLERLNTEVNRQMQASLPEDIKDREYGVQWLTDIHLHSNLESEWKSNNRFEYVIIFGIIASLILAIAAINYINLSTAKSIQRAREVGIRKVMGVSKTELIFQYLGESFITVLISFVIAFGLTEWVLLVVFNTMAEVDLTLDYLFTWPGWFYLITAIIVVAVLSGSYPAFILSDFQPASIFQRKVTSSRASATLRKGLVIFQFAISGFLIAGTLIVYRQVDFIQNKNLGFEKDLIVALKLNNREDQRNVSTLKQLLISQSAVEGVTVSSHLLGGSSPYDNPVLPENSSKEEGYNLFALPVDHDFVNVYGLDIIEGRTFSKENKADKKSSILLNQSALNRFGWDLQDALGKEVQLTWYSDSAEIRETKVIGIIRDFNFNSLRHKVEPVILYLNNHVYYTDYVSVRFAEGSISNAVEILTAVWKDFSPRPADIYFLNDELEQLYISETKASKIIVSFTFLAILLSCIGLFGLSAYSTETRTKEIGIRKVMGANASTIAGMLAKDYLLLITIANFIALPLVWYFGGQWLQNFAYRTTIGSTIFILAFVLSIAVALLTISFQTIKVAGTNPASILKDE